MDDGLLAVFWDPRSRSLLFTSFLASALGESAEVPALTAVAWRLGFSFSFVETTPFGLFVGFWASARLGDTFAESFGAAVVVLLAVFRRATAVALPCGNRVAFEASIPVEFGVALLLFVMCRKFFSGS